MVLKFIITLLVTYSLPTFALEAGLREYIKESYSQAQEAYQAQKCSEVICYTKDFFSQLPSSTQKKGLILYWKELKGMNAPQKLEILQSIIDGTLRENFKQDKSSFSEVFYQWAMLKRMFADLPLKKNTEEYSVFISKLQFLSLQALQFEEAWNLLTTNNKLDLESYWGVQSALVRARMLRFLGQHDEAYKLLLKIVKSPRFIDPDIITSKPLKLQRAWAWSLLKSSASSQYLNYLAQVVSVIASRYIEGFEDELEEQERWLKRLKYASGFLKSDYEVSRNIIRDEHLADSFTETLWTYTYVQMNLMVYDKVFEHELYFKEIELSQRLKMKVRLKEL